MSEWSGTMCGVRQEAAPTDPGYLPWPPRAKVPRVDALLDVEYLVIPGEAGRHERMAVPAIVLGEIAPGTWDLGADGEGLCNLCGCDDGVRCDDDTSGAVVCVADQDVVGPRASFGCTLCRDVSTALGDRGAFVAYRQSRESAGDAPGPYVQVTPLLAGPFCGFVPRGASFDGRVDDPYFKLVPRIPEGGLATDPARWELTWLDRVPHAGGRQYRYQLVYFDGRGEPASYRETNWFTAPADDHMPAAWAAQ